MSGQSQEQQVSIMCICLLKTLVSDLTLQGSYWTSGYDLTSASELKWCTLHYKKEVNEFWGPGMPTRNRGECVQVKLQADGALSI